MGNPELNMISPRHLSKKDFERLSDFIQKYTGIKMPPSKIIMLESRLCRRLRHLGLEDYGEYCDYLFSAQGMEEELIHFVDEITTNKTHFFREPDHFEYLVNQVLPQLLANSRLHSRKKEILLWSAGCSSGEEAYTLAMCLSEHCAKYNFDFQILGTDICNQVLDKARLGIYNNEQVGLIAPPLKRKYLLKSKDTSKSLVRIIPELRHKISFQRLNFMEDFDLRRPADVIFCRNVIIYFDKATQYAVVSRLCRELKTGGYLFMGHSEVLDCQHLPMVSVAPTVYRKI